MFQELGPDDGYNLYELNRALDQVKATVFINDNAAFYAPLMAGLEFMWTKGVGTAATDGATIYWNPDDFYEIDFEMRKSTLIHELRHIADFHFVRQGDRENQEWNIAGDYRINYDLKADGYKIEAPYFIHDPKYATMAVEEIYEDVRKQCAPWGPGGSPPPQGQPGSGAPMPNGAPGGASSNGPRSMAGDLLPASAATVQKAINNVLQAAEAATAAGQPGAIPGSTKLKIDQFKKPIVAWETLLDRFFQELHNDDYTWRRPNRRHQDIYLPTRESNQRLSHLIYYLDVSGSVSDQDVLRFNSEVKHIKDKYNPEKLTLVQFDTQIQDEITFTDSQPFNEIVVVGRGGTCLKCVRDHMMEHEPEAAIVFSDLYVNQMERGPKCPVIWITIGHKAAKVKFGQVIHIPNET